MDASSTRQSTVTDSASSSVSAHPWSFPRGYAWRVLVALIGGLILRLWMKNAFPQNQGDAQIYGNIAKNILLHHQFALTDGSGVLHATLIRLPGYPLFLAACFKLFGVENYTAIAWLQISLELAACLLLADFARHIHSARAGLDTLWLSALCPFTAVYTSAALTESLTFDMFCLALWSLGRYLTRGTKPVWPALTLLTTAFSAAALLRPDGALIAFALWPALLFAVKKAGAPGLASETWVQTQSSRKPNAGAPALAPDILPATWVLHKRQPTIQTALIVAILSILPFAAWGYRNWQTFHVFEPLAPRYANDPGEDPHLGWQHWVKTWCIDFTCTEEVYWNVPDSPLDFAALPDRAFDSTQQKQETEALVAAYNENQELTPAIDQHFQSLAKQRAAAHPLRSNLILPFARLADMTLRPRVENLTIDLRWWQYSLHHSETRFSWSYAALNFVLLILGIVGLCLRPKFWQYMAGYLVLRSVLLMTIEAPETRYTLEFFPVLFVGGGIALQRIFSKSQIP